MANEKLTEETSDGAMVLTEQVRDLREALDAALARAEAAEQWNVTLQNARDVHAAEAAALRAEVERQKDINRAMSASIAAKDYDAGVARTRLAAAEALLRRWFKRYDGSGRTPQLLGDTDAFLSSTPAQPAAYAHARKAARRAAKENI